MSGRPPEPPRVFTPIENLTHALLAWLAGAGLSYDYRVAGLMSHADGTAVVTVIDSRGGRYGFAIYDANDPARRLV